ncbi:MAG: putative polymerase, sigma-24 subunit, subfamily [Ilumatobacteraceae bacterium]|nr:putative polymerase, sigma-24 subunit, subfamily [Ilumatobacteraceae bacterium]
MRSLAPQVLGALTRRYGHFDTCEDAVQEALLAASRQWPRDGVPEHPKGWLIAVASRRLTDALRSDSARRQREDTDAARQPRDRWMATLDDVTERDPVGDVDDTLTLLFMCCHPALTPASQLALTLRAVGGLTTAEIAGACLVPEPTMGQRISRAKQTIRSAGTPFRLPPPDQRADRLGVVLHVLYLIFNEGYTASSGSHLQRADLTREAIRLVRGVHRALPDDGEVAGLLALMLLTDARRAARTGADGSLVPLSEQDRSLWDSAQIAEGVALVSAALTGAKLGPYQVQAAIAAVHDEAAASTETDWPQILALYDVLERISPNPMAELNRVVAVAEVHGPLAGLELLDGLALDSRIAGHHRLDVVRAHLLERVGDLDGAVAAYRRAARRTTSLPEQRHLEGRAARLRR